MWLIAAANLSFGSVARILLLLPHLEWFELVAAFTGETPVSQLWIPLRVRWRNDVVAVGVDGEKESGDKSSHSIQASRAGRPCTIMTVYETISHHQIRSWCTASGYWPGCAPGQPDRIRIGGSLFGERERLDLLDWEDWFEHFDRRQLKFVYDPTKAWCDLQSRNVRPD